MRCLRRWRELAVEGEAELERVNLDCRCRIKRSKKKTWMKFATLVEGDDQTQEERSYRM